MKKIKCLKRKCEQWDNRKRKCKMPNFKNDGYCYGIDMTKLKSGVELNIEKYNKIIKGKVDVKIVIRKDGIYCSGRCLFWQLNNFPERSDVCILFDNHLKGNEKNESVYRCLECINKFGGKQ